MATIGNCRCAVCHVDRLLRDEFQTDQNILQFREYCVSSTALSEYPTPLALISDIREMRHSNGSGAHSDLVLGALRVLSQAGDSKLFSEILIVAFVPLLHATVSSIASRFPAISKHDVTQQALTSLLELLKSPAWLARKSHLAFSLARELRRSVSIWAQGEARFATNVSDLSRQEQSVLPDEQFVHNVTLKHFLFRSLEVGALDDDDLDLLIQFKLDGDFGNGDGGPASNALRQKMKRLVSKMRRRAAYRIPKTN